MVLTDVVIFLSETNHKSSFISLDNKVGVGDCVDGCDDDDIGADEVDDVDNDDDSDDDDDDDDEWW